MTVHLHIDRLVLDGVDLGPGGEHDFHVALRDRLAAVLANESPIASRGSQDVGTLHCAAIELPAHGDGAAIGTATANTLAAGLVP